MPLLSVITPAYNGATYLPEALGSVAGLGTPHEHVVIDGGSDDGTVELLEGRGDPHLSWVSEPDRGQTHAVNKGLARANGELVGWLNADDAYVSDAVDRAVAHLARNAEVMAVYGGMDVIDELGRVRRRYRPPPFSWTRYLFFGDYIPTPTILFRRSLLAKAPSLDERYADAADYDFYLRLLHRARVDRMPDALVRFRYHPDSKTARDVWLQQDEALAIRLAWARGPRDRLIMQGFERLKRLVLPRISSWPKLYEGRRAGVGVGPRVDAEASDGYRAESISSSSLETNRQ
jgi:glycosyltransferase involved in cell wall biosynthesis